MRKTQSLYRIAFVCGMGMLLFACSSKEKKTETAVEPSAPATAEVTPPPAPVNELQMAHFAFNSDRLSRDARKALKFDASWLKKHPSDKVEIQGHCDERGTATYNMKLGEKRAKAVKAYLAAHGVKKSRMKVVSFGFDRPIDTGHNEDAWAKNRRAEPVVTPGS